MYSIKLVARCRIYPMLGSVLALLHVGACEYTEHLDVRPLPRGNVLATFDFEMSQVIGFDGGGLQNDVPAYNLFPRSLGQIMSESNTRELHLRFGQGWWDAEEWGVPPMNGELVGGIGVELWAWIAGNDEAAAWENWRQLTHALGGYFCASLNFVDETVTTFPSENIHKPWGDKPANAWLMRGALPAEPICTENLTPFLKLLPCKGKAGISSLLDGHSLFSSRWQSMSVDAWHGGREHEISLKQTVSNVMNTASRQDDVLPYATKKDELHCNTSKPWANDWTCFPIVPTEAKYSLSAIFGETINGNCPAASKSTVVIDAPQNWSVNGTGERSFDLSGLESPFDLEISTSDNTFVSDTQAPNLFLDRSFSGWGQQSGGIRTVFTNTGDTALQVSYLEMLPWFMRAYLHTLKFMGDGEVVNQSYVPSQERGRPTTMEMTILLPANAHFAIEYNFDKSLLFIEEYPPDANHGFEVPPGIAVARPITREAKPHGMSFYEVRTSSLLLSLPVPDFSMPYNVIILTSTVMAMAFATLINLMCRDVLPEDQVPPRESPLVKIKKKLGLSR